MLKKNCHLVFGSQKSKLALLELVFQTAGAINLPPPSVIGLTVSVSINYPPPAAVFLDSRKVLIIIVGVLDMCDCFSSSKYFAEVCRFNFICKINQKRIFDSPATIINIPL